MALFFPSVTFLIPVFMIGFEAISWTQQSLKGQFLCRNFLREEATKTSLSNESQAQLDIAFKPHDGVATLRQIDKSIFKVNWQLPLNELIHLTGFCQIDLVQRTLK